MVDGISGKSFGTRSAAERAYSALMAKQTRTSPPATVSFVLGLNERNRLCEIADKKGLSLSKLIKLIVEKQVGT